MIKAHPVYKNGDNTGIGKYFEDLIHEYQFTYSSVWKWWWKTSMAWGLGALAIGLILFVIMLPQRFIYGYMEWDLLCLVIPLPLVIFMPPIWLVSFYKSFIKPKRTASKIKSFISKNIPDAHSLEQLSPTNFKFKIEDIRFEAAFPVFLYETLENDELKFGYYFVIAISYNHAINLAKNISKSPIAELFIENWHKFAQETCKYPNIVIDKSSIYVRYPRKAMPSSDEVMPVVEYMKELLVKLEIMTLAVCMGKTPDPDENDDIPLTSMPNPN